MLVGRPMVLGCEKLFLFLLQDIVQDQTLSIGTCALVCIVFCSRCATVLEPGSLKVLSIRRKPCSGAGAVC